MFELSSYEGSKLSSPNFQTNGTFFWGRWELLVRRCCSVVRIHGKISSIVILPLKFSVFSINGMGIITFIHAGATIPLLFGNKLMAHSTHSHCYRHPASLKKHFWLKRTQRAEKQTCFLAPGWSDRCEGWRTLTCKNGIGIHPKSRFTVHCNCISCHVSVM